MLSHGNGYGFSLHFGLDLFFGLWLFLDYSVYSVIYLSDMDTITTNAEALGYLKEINRLEKRMIKYLAPINAKIRDLEEKVKLTCIHNDTENKFQYVEGGYLNRCQYITRKICKVCGKILEEDIEEGGFN